MSSQNEIIDFINSDIAAIKRYDRDIKNTYIYIARRLHELKESNYIEQINFKGYKNIYDFALSEFGYEASKVRYLIAIYLRFFKDFETVTKNNVSMTGVKQSKYNEFSISQLRYMCEMDEEQLKKCKPEMTVKEIIEIKLNFDTCVSDKSVETQGNVQNESNEKPVQNIISGIFPEKSEERPEEKVTTIIVTELPKEERKENKTITIDVKTEQNDSFGTNIIDENQEDYYKKKYHEALELNEKLKNEYKNLENIISNEQVKNKNLREDLHLVNQVIKYFDEEFYKVVSVFYNEKLQILYKEFSDFYKLRKLPDKVNFFKNVI